MPVASAGRWLAAGVAVVIGHAEARAELCTAPTPACHLENGKALLTSSPRRAAEELLASYQLDERTDTLVLYATALALDERYAAALETWKRVIVFRDSELDAARQALRRASGSRRAAARDAVTRSQQQNEQAAEAILKLWPKVGRVRIRFAPGARPAVSRGGAAVDASQDVLVNAGRDELVFTRLDGSVANVVVEVAAGSLAKIDAPGERLAAIRPEPVVAANEPPAPAGKPEPVAAAKLPAARPEPTSGAKPAPAEPVAAPAPVAAEPRWVDEPRSPRMARIGVGLVGGAVVAGGIAVGLGYLAGRDRDRAHQVGCTADDQCPAGPAADLAARSNDRARLAQITALGAGALAATGVTLWILGRGKTRHTVTDLTLHVGPSSTAISGRF
ncbi:MAG TPA: hypothetical protein VFK02_05945 [Kofleriaceae bacterium]|nr:hypothetical protein [Kofleriaceae bacterium]